MKYDKRDFFTQLSTGLAHWENDAVALMAAKVNFVVSGFEAHHAEKHAELLKQFKYTFGRNENEPLAFFHHEDSTPGQAQQN